MASLNPDPDLYWEYGSRSRTVKIVWMANYFLRLLSSFACVSVKLDGKRKKVTVFAHIVGGVHIEGARNGFLLKYEQ